MTASLNMECSEEVMYTMTGYDFDWKCFTQQLYMYVIDIDNEGGIEEGMGENKSLEWTPHNPTCTYQELVKVGADREKNATAGHVKELEREFKSEGT